ncbi:UPF0182 family protein, partial [Cellulomonas endometrii]|uniref:UPF0182 family protein n=1 Tax=Cellulomonas endometrii TaxID=3036301 RepID=UPI0031F8FC4D
MRVGGRGGEHVRRQLAGQAALDAEPALGVGLMVVGAVVIGGIYPAVVQRFQVNPNQQDAEAEYIQR